MLVDVRDESTDDVRIVLELKPGADPALVMAYLYKHTPLELNFHVNMTCLVPTRQPRRSLGPCGWTSMPCSSDFLDFRQEVVTRRFEFELAELERRIHILEGFAIVFDALDETIRIIRKSDGKADAARQADEAVRAWTTTRPTRSSSSSSTSWRASRSTSSARSWPAKQRAGQGDPSRSSPTRASCGR